MEESRYSITHQAQQHYGPTEPKPYPSMSESTSAPPIYHDRPTTSALHPGYPLSPSYPYSQTITPPLSPGYPSQRNYDGQTTTSSLKSEYPSRPIYYGQTTTYSHVPEYKSAPSTSYGQSSTSSPSRESTSPGSTWYKPLASLAPLIAIAPYLRTFSGTNSPQHPNPPPRDHATINLQSSNSLYQSKPVSRLQKTLYLIGVPSY